jgi:hypothetical protein
MEILVELTRRDRHSRWWFGEGKFFVYQYGVRNYRVGVRDIRVRPKSSI